MDTHKVLKIEVIYWTRWNANTLSTLWYTIMHSSSWWYKELHALLKQLKTTDLCLAGVSFKISMVPPEARTTWFCCRRPLSLAILENLTCYKLPNSQELPQMKSKYKSDERKPLIIPHTFTQRWSMLWGPCVTCHTVMVERATYMGGPINTLIYSYSVIDSDNVIYTGSEFCVSW